MKSINIVVLSVSLTLLNFIPVTSSAETITTSGSSTVHEIVHAASDVYQKIHPDVNFVVGTGGSKKGIKAVSSGEVDIGQSGRMLKNKEKKAYPDLVPYEIAQDGVALIVNINNPISNLTKNQVQDIYTGKISNWKDVGGDYTPIHCISKHVGRSAHELFLKYFGLESKETGQGKNKRVLFNRKGESPGTAQSISVGPNSTAVGQVSTKKQAIAFLSIGYANELAHKGARIKLIKLDGIEANPENIRNGTYPLKRSLYVFTKGKPEGEVKSFIDFLLGEKGQEIVDNLHFIKMI